MGKKTVKRNKEGHSVFDLLHQVHEPKAPEEKIVSEESEEAKENLFKEKEITEEKKVLKEKINKPVPESERKKIKFFTDRIGRNVTMMKPNQKDAKVKVRDKNHAQQLFNLQESGIEFV